MCNEQLVRELQESLSVAERRAEEAERKAARQGRELAALRKSCSDLSVVRAENHRLTRLVQELKRNPAPVSTQNRPATAVAVEVEVDRRGRVLVEELVLSECHSLPFPALFVFSFSHLWASSSGYLLRTLDSQAAGLEVIANHTVRNKERWRSPSLFYLLRETSLVCSWLGARDAKLQLVEHRGDAVSE